MAGCTESKKAECRAQGKVCNQKSGRCKEPAKKSKGPAMSPSTSLVQAAVVEAASPGVASSLMSKGYSSGLGGVGMTTLTKQTKKEVKKMSGRSRARYGPDGLEVNWSAPGVYRRAPAGSKKRASSSRKGRRPSRASGMMTANGVRANWSGSGLPSGSRAQCSKPCAKTKSGTARFRNGVSCKCLAVGGDAARLRGECAPRTGTRNGTAYTYETVPMPYTMPDGRRSVKCVKAGGSAAKQALGQKGCPAGKVIDVSRKEVPVMVKGKFTGQFKEVTSRRCVKAGAAGTQKNCPINQVVVSVLSAGQTPPTKQNPNGKPWTKRVQKCVTPKTAAKKGYSVIRAGTLPIRPKRTRVAMSPGR